MTQSIATENSGDFTWLYDTQSQQKPVLSLLIRTLCEEMRKVVQEPGCTPKSPLPAMRAELKRLLDRAKKANRLFDGSRGDVFGSLDPQSIGELLSPEGAYIYKDTWNKIAQDITPEIVDAYCAPGNQVNQLPYLSTGHDPVPYQTALRLIDNWNDPDTIFMTRFFMAAADGRCPVELALYAIRHWIAHWPLPRSTSISSGSSAPNWTIMHVVAAHDGHSIEPWEIPGSIDLNKVLTMTFSAHGRLMLHQRLSSLEDLLQNPGKTLTCLAR